MPTALITGASTGIGLALARQCAGDGCELILVARDETRLDAVAAELRNVSGRPARGIPLDLAKPGAARQLRALVRQPVDYLINNAGFGLGGHFAKTDLAVESEMMQVNVIALVELTKLFLQEMTARGSGRVLNVASTAAFQPGPLMAIYFASKAFVLSFSEAIAEELRDSGVTVTALCPGPTQSEFQKRAQIENTRLVKKQSMGMMTAMEVAKAGYRGMLQGRVIVIPGLGNRLGVESLRIAPRGIVRRASRMLQEG